MKAHILCQLLALMAATSVVAADNTISNLLLKASTDKANPIDYTIGETIRFDFFLDGATELPPEMATNTPLSVKWTRRGDDGVKKTGKSEISLENGFSMTTSLAVPGFVRITAQVLGANGKAYTFEYDKGKTIKDFEFGAGVATEDMQLSTVEPADFDDFWAEAKAKLATVPINDENVELVDVTPAGQVRYCTTYAVKIPCYGPRPVTGWLIVPKNAQPGTLDVRAVFEGYGMIKAAPSPPNYNSGNSQIRFNVNAHGYDLIGQDDQYYQDMYDTLYPTNRKSYALEASDYDSPTNTYFYYMAMRVMRAFEYLKSRPEWNGRGVIAEGGSQGGMQTMWAGGLVEGISQIKPSVTWCCDLGNPFPSTSTSPLITKGWGVPSVPNAYYFDAALHAKRVPRTCTANLTRLGMGDYTCPPRGVLLSYYNLKCAAQAKLVQGSTHSFTPPATNQTFTLSKEALPEPPPPQAVAFDAPGYDWTNRVVTVTNVTAGAELTLELSAPDGSQVVSAVQTADSDGIASFAIPTAPGSNYTYSISQDGTAIAAGSFLTGGWDAPGTWFLTAPDGAGGSTEVNGTWTTPPTATNATSYTTGEFSSFALTADALAAGSGKIVRVETGITFPALRGSVSPSFQQTLADSLAMLTAAERGNETLWLAHVGGRWVELRGAIEPDANTPYVVRLEGDFTLAEPRVRFRVSDDDGATFATLSDAGTGAEWLVPSDADKRVLSEIGTSGRSSIAGICGTFSNADVAAAGGTGHASLEDALADGGEISLLTNATWPTNAPAGTVTVNRGDYTLILPTNGVSVVGNSVVVSAGFSILPGVGTLHVNFGDLSAVGIETANRTPAQIAADLLTLGDNGIPKWQSYVLGLDTASLPYATISMDATSGNAVVSLGGVEVNKSAGATVTYQVYEVADLADSDQDDPIGNPEQPEVDVPVAANTSPAKFFRLKVFIDVP